MTTAHSTVTASRPTRTGRHRSTRPRTLHLIDLENLLCGRVDPRSVVQVWDEYRRVTGLRWDDHVVVSVAKRHAPATFFALPASVQRVIGADEADGADTALLDAVQIDWAATRFRQVMLASGDHIFGDVARTLRGEGLHLVQVIGGGLCGSEIYRQCHDQLYLPLAQRRAQRYAARRVERELCTND